MIGEGSEGQNRPISAYKYAFFLSRSMVGGHSVVCESPQHHNCLQTHVSDHVHMVREFVFWPVKIYEVTGLPH